VITSGYWSKDATKKIAQRLAQSGVNSVFISVDVFHQEHVPLEIVKRTAAACLEAGIKDVVWNPCWVVSADDDNWYNRKTRAILKELEDLPVRNSKGNVVEPEGFALINLKELLPPRKVLPEGRCGDRPHTYPLDSIRSILIEPDGRVAVCKDLHIGNSSKTDIREIIEDYDPFKVPEMKAIIEGGMRGLLEWARARGVESDSRGYYSICQMCIDIRRRVSEKFSRNVEV